MEFTDCQIARLVFGYLKSEDCISTCNTFLDESPHFENTRDDIRAGKCYPTRVFGMSLVEFLEEYASIYTLVQARLEATNYFKENRHKSSLGIIKNLLYLLDAGPILNSTPITRENISEVDTTPSHTLPGNSGNIDNNTSDTAAAAAAATHRITPKRKCQKTKGRDLNKAVAVNDTSNSNKLDTSELIAQTLLDKTDLHIKLAQTINHVLNSPEVVATKQDEVSAGASKELEAIIKSVVQRTEEDPMYSEIIGELIGNPTFDHVITKNVLNTTNPNDTSRTKRNKSATRIDSVIDKQNEDAIRGIISVSQNMFTTTLTTSSASMTASTDTTTTVTTQSSYGVSQQLQSAILNQCMKSNEPVNNSVFVYDGSLDTYIKNNTAQGANVNHQLFFGTPSLILVPPSSNYDEKQIYVVNNVISETDIMSMPTVIVNDGSLPKQQTEVSGDNPRSSRMQTRSSSSVNTENATLAPIHVSVPITSALESNSLDPSSSTDNVPVLAIAEKDIKVDTSPTVDPSDTNKNSLEKSKSPNKTKETNTKDKTKVTTKAKSSEKPSTKSQKVSNSVSPIRSKPKEIRQTTPRHVRNLDFSSPTEKDNKKATSKQWDAELRQLIAPDLKICNRDPVRKKKKPPSKARRKITNKSINIADDEAVSKQSTELNKSNNEDETDNNKSDKENSKTKIKEEKNDNQNNQKDQTWTEDDLIKKNNVSIIHDTPIKDRIPKTPCIGSSLTPFAQLLEDQLLGVNISEIPTPSIPITPGLGLTPFDAQSMRHNNRGTDYSASSSYYVPSDTEQNKSIEQLVEESKAIETRSIKVLSDVVIEPDAIVKTTLHSEIKRTFDRNVVGRKNLSLVKKDLHTSPLVSPTSSSASSSSSQHSISSSDNESDGSEEPISTTVIEQKDKTKNVVGEKKNNESSKKNINSEKEEDVITSKKQSNQKMIQNIISRVPACSKLSPDVEDERNKLRQSLDEKRKRVIEKMREVEQPKRKTTNQKAKPQPKVSSTRKTRNTTRGRKKIDKDNQDKTNKIMDNVEDKFVPISPKKVNNDHPPPPTSIGSNDLVSDLWQRGIHLIPKTFSTPIIETKNPQQQAPTIQSTPSTSKIIENEYGFSMKTFDEWIEIKHEEGSKKVSKQYDLSVLNKGFQANVYIEEIDEDVIRDLRVTPFQQILFLSPKSPQKRTRRNTINSQKNSVVKNLSDLKTNEEEEIMDLAVSGSLRDESPDEKLGSKNVRKRKMKVSEEEKPSDKKTKLQEKEYNEVLKNLNINSFLDQVHKDG